MFKFITALGGLFQHKMNAYKSENNLVRHPKE